MGDRITLDLDIGEAGRAGAHPPTPRFRVFAAPASPGSPVRFNAIEPGLFTIACWRMEDARFDFDSSFVRPEAKKELRLLAVVARQETGSPLSVFGHADPTGKDDYNKTLSGRRARAIHALLIRNTETWEDLFSHAFGGDQWGQAQIRSMLGALPSAKTGEPYTTAASGPGAIKLFQEEHGLKSDGDAGPKTRAALFAAYMDFLCDGDALRLKPDDFLGGGADDKGKGDFQGCSEFNPTLVFSRDETKAFVPVNTHPQRDAENVPNRRVVIFFFKPGTRVDDDSWPCPRVTESAAGCKARFWSDGEDRRNPQGIRRTYEDSRDTFGCRFYDRLAMKSPCEASLPLTTFAVRLTDHEKTPIPNAPFRARRGASVREGRADHEGWIFLQAVRRPDKLLVEWTLPELEQEDDFPFSREYFVDVAGDDDRRLFNLGYIRPKREDNVTAYQRDFGHPETGKIADIQDELRAFHDGGNRPA